MEGLASESSCSSTAESIRERKVSFFYMEMCKTNIKHFHLYSCRVIISATLNEERTVFYLAKIMCTVWTILLRHTSVLRFISGSFDQYEHKHITQHCFRISLTASNIHLAIKSVQGQNTHLHSGGTWFDTRWMPAVLNVFVISLFFSRKYRQVSHTKSNKSTASLHFQLIMTAFSCHQLTAMDWLHNQALLNLYQWIVQARVGSKGQYGVSMQKADETNIWTGR